MDEEELSSLGCQTIRPTGTRALGSPERMVVLVYLTCSLQVELYKFPTMLLTDNTKDFLS